MRPAYVLLVKQAARYCELSICFSASCSCVSRFWVSSSTAFFWSCFDRDVEAVGLESGKGVLIEAQPPASMARPTTATLQRERGASANVRRSPSRRAFHGCIPCIPSPVLREARIYAIRTLPTAATRLGLSTCPGDTTCAMSRNLGIQEILGRREILGHNGPKTV